MKAIVRFSLLLSIFAALPALAASLSPEEQAAAEKLMEKSGCISCHRVDQKLIGPPFKNVSAKYRADSDAPGLLFEKVREGGEGVWGDIPMIANGPEKISDADLQRVLEWVLSL